MAREISAFHDRVQGDGIWLIRTDRTQYRVEVSYEEAEIRVSGPGIFQVYDLSSGVFYRLISTASISDADLAIMAVIMAESGVSEEEL